MRKLLSRFRRDERGAAAIEAAFIMPMFLIVVTAFYDIGALMLRQVTLRAGVEDGARLIRLNGTIDPANPTPSPQELRDDYIALICGNVVLVRDCDSRLVIDMREIDVGGTFPSPSAPCVRTLPNGQPSTQFTNGVNNTKLVYVRVCAPSSTLFGNYGIAGRLQDANGDQMIRVKTAFLWEL